MITITLAALLSMPVSAAEPSAAENLAATKEALARIEASLKDTDPVRQRIKANQDATAELLEINRREIDRSEWEGRRKIHQNWLMIERTWRKWGFPQQADRVRERMQQRGLSR